MLSLSFLARCGIFISSKGRAQGASKNERRFTMAATITEFTATEMDWIDRATINGKREILEQELVDAPKDSLLRNGVIAEKNGKIVVAPEYADLFHCASAKTAKAAKITKKDDTMTETTATAATSKQVQIHYSGFKKITSKLTNALCESIDDEIATVYSEDAFNGFISKIRIGLRCNDDQSAIEWGAKARSILVEDITKQAAEGVEQPDELIISTISAKKTRLAAIASQECDWFPGVRVCNDINPKQVEFSGPRDAAIAAAIMYTYNAIICNRHAQRAYDDAHKAGTGTTNVYNSALAEAVKWLG